ncbi:MAG: 23S rRNA (adenine(2030)-N(6))-methyltransferase RlmJ [Alphaproteobacteria bacterium]|nr:23S rRNA (adenine(2030)-N(6))-methyltransferase RlmJ [Alphaproteobacteria bacterium]
MNYRHAFHAGNHGDVLKHAVLARTLELLKAKDKPFAVLDAHAGIGRYDLQSVQANKTGEWQGGIAKMDDDFSPEVEAILSPYRQVLATLNPDGEGRFYPGSPEIVVRLMRKDDRLVANELHPIDVEELRAVYATQKNVSVTQLDFIQAVKVQLPFRERRGLVLIDPPFEVLDETLRTAKAIEFGYRRMANAVFMIWYPVTTEEFAAQFVATLQALNIPNMLQAELRVKYAFAQGGLSGSGLVIINPPFGLEKDLQALLPALAGRLGLGEWGRGTVQWLTPLK